MAWKSTTDPEMMPLLRVLRSRIEGLRAVEQTQKDGMEIYKRSDQVFLQLEIRRDHVNLDLWLPAERVEEARSSGLGRTHPFLAEAIKVRFERAEDLTKVTTWLEESHRYAEVRAKKAARDAARDARRAAKAGGDPATSPASGITQDPGANPSGSSTSRPKRKTSPGTNGHPGAVVQAARTVKAVSGSKHRAAKDGRTGAG